MPTADVSDLPHTTITELQSHPQVLKLALGLASAAIFRLLKT